MMAGKTDADKDAVDDYNDKTAQIKSQAQAGFNSTMNQNFSDFSSGMNTTSNTQCPTDKSVSVLGRSFVIPFSNICPALQVFHALIIIFAYLYAARIIFSAVNSSGGQ